MSHPDPRHDPENVYPSDHYKPGKITYAKAVALSKEKKAKKETEPNWMRDSYKRGMAKKMSPKKKYIKEASFEAESKLYKNK